MLKKWQQAVECGYAADQFSRKGEYVFFGATRNTSDAHKKQFGSLKEDQKIVEVWGKSKTLVSDCAVSVVVEKSEGPLLSNSKNPIIGLSDYPISSFQCFRGEESGGPIIENQWDPGSKY